MNKTVFIQIFLTNFNLIFGAILCFLPVYGHLKYKKSIFFPVTAGLLTLFLLLSSYFIQRYQIPDNYILFLSFPVFFLLYLCSVDISLYKALSIFLVVTSILCFAGNYTYIFSAYFYPTGVYTDHSWEGAFFSFTISLAFLLMFWHLFRKHLRWLIDHLHITSIWRTTILWALMFIAVSNFMVPYKYSTLYTNRLFEMGIAILTTILVIMLSLYYMLYRMAMTNYELTKLERQNQFLSFQSNQYNALVNHMKSTRKLRHDFRQQLLVIGGLVKKRNFESLETYLSDYTSSIDDNYTPLTGNPAVNAVASYYDQLAREADISASWALNLPQQMPLPESDFCVMLGNLLENSIAGCHNLPADQRILKVTAYMPSNSMLILLVENTYQGHVHRKNDIFYSTKHAGQGLGIASVRETVERYHGNLDIQYNGEVFSVNILLNL